jgi:hypothetical protein
MSLYVRPPPNRLRAQATTDQYGFPWFNQSCAMDSIATVSGKILETLEPPEQRMVAGAINHGNDLFDWATGTINNELAKERFQSAVYHRRSIFKLGVHCDIQKVWEKVVKDSVQTVIDLEDNPTDDILEPLIAPREAFNIKVSMCRKCSNNRCSEYNHEYNRITYQNSLILPLHKNQDAFKPIDTSLNSYMNDLRQVSCDTCGRKSVTRRRTMATLPIIMKFDVSILASSRSFNIDLQFLIDDASLTNGVAVYVIAAVIYAGGRHFTARYVDPASNVYYYDGINDGHSGKCQQIGPLQNNSFPTKDQFNRTACAIFYRLQNV